MYGKDFSLHTSEETTYNNIVVLNEYYFGSDYEFDEKTETFKITGDIISGTFRDMKESFVDYPYTCKNINSTDSCQVMIKVNSYVSEKQVRAQYITYSSNSYESTLTNEFQDCNRYMVSNKYSRKE